MSTRLYAASSKVNYIDRHRINKWAKMEAFANIIKVSLPNYLKNLPLPNSFGALGKLTGKPQHLADGMSRIQES